MMGSTADPRNAPVANVTDEGPEWQRKFTNWMLKANQGKVMATGVVTLGANTFSTSVMDSRCSVQSFIEFMPETANAATERTGGMFYVSTLDNGRFVITHSSNAITDRRYTYTLMG